MYYQPAYGKKSSPPTGLYIGIRVALAALVSSLAVSCASNPDHAVIPLTSASGSFIQGVSPSKVFACAIPKGWTVTSSSDGDMDDVTMTDGNVSIDVSLSNVPPASISNSRLAPDPNDTSDAAALAAETAVDHFKGLSDQKITCPIGSGDVVEFTGDLRPVTGDNPPKTGPVHGMSSNIVTQNTNHVLVLCFCSPAEWDEAKPVFNHVIKSLAPAGHS